MLGRMRIFVFTAAALALLASSNASGQSGGGIDCTAMNELVDLAGVRFEDRLRQLVAEKFEVSSTTTPETPKGKMPLHYTLRDVGIVVFSAPARSLFGPSADCSVEYRFSSSGQTEGRVFQVTLTYSCRFDAGFPVHSHVDNCSIKGEKRAANGHVEVKRSNKRVQATRDDRPGFPSFLLIEQSELPVK